MFSIDLKKPENYAGSSAPVHYPRIWNTPWFDWVQYNGSIMQPMVRNAGELLGVSAELNLIDPSKGLYKSSVNVESLFEMEQMIKGDTQPNAKDGFPGLKSPKWPSDILPPIDQKLAAQGRRTLQDPLPGMSPPAGVERCVLRFQQQGLVDEERGRRADPEGREHSDLAYRDRSRAGGRHGEPNGCASRKSRNRQSSSFAFALGDVVEKTVNYVYDQKKPPVSAAERKRIDGYMPNELQGELAYKVRPLNGVWATPPYLHNGSVPTIDASAGPTRRQGRRNSISAAANTTP